MIVDVAIGRREGSCTLLARTSCKYYLDFVIGYRSVHEVSKRCSRMAIDEQLLFRASFSFFFINYFCFVPCCLTHLFYVTVVYNCVIIIDV